MSKVLKRIVGRLGWRRSGSIQFRGNYSQWSEALRDSKGYDSPAILEKTRAAALKVKKGEAAFERDSVAFETLELPFPLLAGLLRAAGGSGGRLSVLDFGGSLGSTYFQCRGFLATLSHLHWSVVEQPDHARCGKEELQTPELGFFDDVGDCIARHDPNVLLLGSVLQYLPTPRRTIANLLSNGIQHVLVDRTAFHTGSTDRLTVQTVPEWIYPATYPAWFFEEAGFLGCFSEKGYRLVADYDCNDRVSLEQGQPYFKGFIFEKQECQ